MLHCPKCGGLTEKGECRHCGLMSPSLMREQKTATCWKCGLGIRWRHLPSGKFCPENLGGSDHWDICSETAWKNAPESVKTARLAKHPPLKTHGIRPKLYRGEKPPWEFDTWAWIDPADEAKKQKWLSDNGYLELLLAKAS